MNLYTLGLAISLDALIALLKIIAIDIVLSGDNAIVIAMATRRLPNHQQNKAIFWGTGGAVLLRILFAAIIVFLLNIPFVHLLGGLLLLWIAYKVLVEHEEEANIQSSDRLLKAIGTIILADAVMSLDNVVAVAGASEGHIGMIAFGVAVSIPIMVFGSKAIMKVMERYAWITYVGSGILAWTGGKMMMEDEGFTKFLHIPHGPLTYAISAGLTIFVLAAGYITNKKAESKEETMA
ncbi:TerC family protein [Thermaerobacillus caldiproteolyticus]|uniref:YjbE family integral membrane protein n=1 Tax=Thermaerobacillus caldiproteolyticus TaxID=247480 RepID=A0A7V9Z9U2_9BACL|nr:TerC family protein [Anoxybacillus caldiproteolyticus]MBA2876630.1 YjbE family integral membrane protein [Anoxybacillus caldiproteolyticus]QPA31313.1 TerC family protein [Anoxybacillus caldiproteolyticus]